MADKQDDFTLDWDKLTAPVPEADIEWVQKAGGKMFPYMTAQFLRRRLDSIVEGHWSYDCEHIPFVGYEQPDPSDGELFVVKGTLTIYSDGYYVSRASFGSGKNFKEAETDAFKRAAQRLGIGNELYEMDAQSAVGISHRAQPPVAPARDQAGNAPKAVPATDGLNPSCPVCSGRMWDNRANKRNPKSPDFKCRDRQCDGVIWRESDLQPKPGNFKDELDRKMDEDPY